MIQLKDKKRQLKEKYTATLSSSGTWHKTAMVIYIYTSVLDCRNPVKNWQNLWQLHFKPIPPSVRPNKKFAITKFPNWGQVLLLTIAIEEIILRE